MNWTIDETPVTRVFWAGELALENATESTTGGRKVKFKLIRNPAEQATLNPFAQATLRRNKRAGTRFKMSLAAIEPGHLELLLETMLLAWGDNPHGSSVTLLLDHEGEHPFMRMAHGDRFMAAFVELADDDSPVDESARRRHEAVLPVDVLVDARQDGGPLGPRPARMVAVQKLSNQAAILLKQEDFRVFLGGLGTNYEDADHLLKSKCCVQSKSQLDSSEDAAELFRELRAAFNSR